MTTGEEIRVRLQAVFDPLALRVVDDSERHRGHAGWREGGETHFRIEIEAPALSGMSRIARHRAIHEALGPALLSRIHALQIAASG